MNSAPEPSPRRTHSTGTPWEKTVAYSRAVRVGPHVFVAGTTASDEQGRCVAPEQPYEQAVYILQKIEAALAAVGARRSDVVRTRMFVIDIRQWPEIGRAHGEFFQGINPAATLVEVRALVDPQLLVEIEVDALVQD